MVITTRISLSPKVFCFSCLALLDPFLVKSTTMGEGKMVLMKSKKKSAIEVFKIIACRYLGNLLNKRIDYSDFLHFYHSLFSKL